MGLDEENRMTLDEVQTWLQRGMSATDAGFGLVFQACTLPANDTADSKLLSVAQAIGILKIGEELELIRKNMDKIMRAPR